MPLNIHFEVGATTKIELCLSSILYSLVIEVFLTHQKRDTLHKVISINSYSNVSYHRPCESWIKITIDPIAHFLDVVEVKLLNCIFMSYRKLVVCSTLGVS